MKVVSRVLLSVLLATAFANQSTGQIRFWFSSSPGDSTPPLPGNHAEIDHPLAIPGQIHLWTKPETGQSLENFSLNIVSDNEDVLQLGGVQVHNELAGDTNRFESIVDSYQTPDVSDVLELACFVDFFDLDAEVPEQALWGFRGFTVADGGGMGVGPVSADADASFDAENGTWLLASIDYTPLQLGTANLFLQIGEIGMSQVGGESSELSVSFGDPNDPVLNAKNDRCTSSSTSDATIHIVESLPGDFNGNAMLDAGDIDLLSMEVVNGTHIAGFNLSGNAQVNETDRTFWVEELKGTFFGDANLDGSVAFDDFLTLSTNFGQAGGWSDGDFNGNNEIDFADFLRLSSNFGEPSAVAAVPEPMISNFALLSALGPLVLRNRSRFNPSR